MNDQIAILTTVANFELYQKTAPLFPSEIPRYVIDGRNGMHGLESIAYMMKKLRGKGIKWLVMADEDVVLVQAQKLFAIISQMKEEGISVCGIRDGGVILHRRQNPYVINTFFSILDFEQVEGIWNESEIRKHQYIGIQEFEDDLSAISGAYDPLSVYEPYYCFYFWLRRKGKRFLFLKSHMLADAITNAVDYQGETFLLHTWYARSYGKNQKHTSRIDAVLATVDQANAKPTQMPNFTLFKDKTFAARHQVKKYMDRIAAKLK